MRTLMDPGITIPEPQPEARRAAPESWQRLSETYPEVVMAYDELSDACRAAGPLGPHTVALIKLAVSVGSSAGRTVHSHAKKALREGVDVEALRQVALIALPTIGLPAALDALKWIEESIRESGAA
jgi:alkylhydroperoxidase/carboxymuconolactone decarboxylase family protein YurZ